MGGTKQYKETGTIIAGGEYKTVGVTVNGIKKLVKVDSGSINTPQYSHTPGTMYAKTNRMTRKVEQVAVYGNGNDGKLKKKDIDTGHKHTNRINGMVFEETDIHVHEIDKYGRRSGEARKPSKKEKRLIMVARFGRS